MGLTLSTPGLVIIKKLVSFKKVLAKILLVCCHLHANTSIVIHCFLPDSKFEMKSVRSLINQSSLSRTLTTTSNNRAWFFAKVKILNLYLLINLCFFLGKRKDKWPQYPLVQGHVCVRDGDRHRHSPGVGHIPRE